jgi:tetratricopeptide (TPR) repeat protein
VRAARARRQAVFASGLLQQATRRGNLHALSTGITRLQQAVAALPIHDGARADFVDVLGTATWRKFELTGALPDLDAVIAARQLAAAGFDGPASQAAYQHNLANALRIRFEQTQLPADIEAAIGAARLALDYMAGDDLRRSQTLSLLGLVLQLRFGQSGRLADVNEAVSLGQEAADFADADDLGRSGVLTNLANSLMRRYERLEEPADLGRAVAASQEACQRAITEDRDRPGMLVALSNALRFRAERTGSLADLDAAIDAAHDAVEADAAGGHPHGLPFSTLGLAQLRRYERTGEPSDLDAAVTAGWQAADATSVSDPSRVMYLSNVSGALLRRFERTGTLRDLDDAVDASQRAVDAATGQQRARCLGNLANALEARFARTGQPADVDRAEDASRAAIAAAARGDAHRGSYLNSLVNALRLRSQDRLRPEQGAGSADLDEAVTVGRSAVTETPMGSPGRDALVASLSAALLLRSRRNGRSAELAEADLDEAVHICRRALDDVPAEHPSRAAYSNVLLAALHARFQRNADPADRRDAIDAARQAVAVTAAPASTRAQAAMGWGQLATETADWPEAIRAYEAEAELLPQIAPLSLARTDQEFQLSQVAGFGPRAAACCLELGRPERALELLEQGRGILLAQALDTRDSTTLARQHPEIANRFAVLRNELDGAGIRRPELADERDGVVAEIRRLPGFERFNLPPRAADLIEAADQGPVVLVNVSDLRSDALLVTRSGIRAVRLTGASAEAVRAHVLEFITALGELTATAVAPDVADRAEARLLGVLGWLWDTVAGPVLAELGITSRPDGDQPPPRIWWCPGGLLSFLPLHAAGDHRTRFDATPQTVIDRVISSYTPTVRALLHARRPSPAVAESGSGILVVAMPHTPGAPDLPGAPRESAWLRARFGSQVLVLSEGSALATNESVSAAMTGYPWAHFACHAASRIDNPSGSCLLLHDYADRPLTVLAIARLRLDHAELAFLSACSTARTGAALPDEAINLASAFQLAGYRRVVGTLWPVDDRLAVRLAENFYETLAQTGTGEGAAWALHRATGRLRATHADQPSAWAAHMHSGI